MNHDSEHELRRKLNDARMRAALFARDLSKSRASHSRQQRISITKARIRTAELRRIGQVEELRPKHKALVVGNRKTAFNRHVEIMLPGTTHNAHAAVAKI